MAFGGLWFSQPQGSEESEEATEDKNSHTITAIGDVESPEEHGSELIDKGSHDCEEVSFKMSNSAHNCRISNNEGNETSNVLCERRTG